MELAQLKMVKAVAQTGSVAQAALQLHCVPSNITTRIKQLESELGTPLFIRAGRGLAISAAGEVFLDYCERILALVEESKRAVDSNAIPRGKLRIGAVESSASGRLPPLLAEYHRRYPQVELELVTGAWAQLLDDLQHHRIDAALVAAGGKRPKLEQSVVYSERLVLITSASSAPIASRTPGTWPAARCWCGRPAARIAQPWRTGSSPTTSSLPSQIMPVGARSLAASARGLAWHWRRKASWRATSRPTN